MRGQGGPQRKLSAGAPRSPSLAGTAGAGVVSPRHPPITSSSSNPAGRGCCAARGGRSIPGRVGMRGAGCAGCGGSGMWGAGCGVRDAAAAPAPRGSGIAPSSAPGVAGWPRSQRGPELSLPGAPCEPPPGPAARGARPGAERPGIAAGPCSTTPPKGPPAAPQFPPVAACRCRMHPKTTRGLPGRPLVFLGCIVPVRQHGGG